MCLLAYVRLVSMLKIGLLLKKIYTVEIFWTLFRSYKIWELGLIIKWSKNWWKRRENFLHCTRCCVSHLQDVPLATEPSIYLTILPLMRILQRNLKPTTDTLLFISHTTNVLLFKNRCNIFIGVRIIKEMPGSVASGTHCIWELVLR